MCSIASSFNFRTGFIPDLIKLTNCSSQVCNAHDNAVGCTMRWQINTFTLPNTLLISVLGISKLIDFSVQIQGDIV